ncbi:MULTISPECIES: hypothetical protein [unclassified Crossiella]|nr:MULTISPECIES: hypothetical protein [unclassified Crossiella]MCK2240157.1 hypothetical protein [Crossiella sp. S99.2]MCK2253391.1 hypothetical protein [Crossiella sp. S99.1]
MEPYDEDNSGRQSVEQRFGEPGWGSTLHPVEPADTTRPHGLFTDVAH